uniref:Putative Hydantoinase B/oxoprolinase n=1 Tax=Moniliophthora roreri TaxID=221103 RepID=A0A0W0FHD3_MONRR
MSSAPDPILLTLFANRFMSVAEAMGRSLQRTAISTNIKERLDFSCALFGPDGSLVSNAPHIPVHLGSMSYAVRYQIELLGIGADAPSGNGIEQGDVIMTNSPQAGGTHLPDITLITPVFSEAGEIIFFTASRGHHADIGGILPGSMPPTSTTIFEEGAHIKSFKLVQKGKHNRDGLIRHMVDVPASYEGTSGTRCFRDVESDLKAQIAANRKGIELIYSMIEEYGLATVQEYMIHIRNNAELAVRSLLKRHASIYGAKLHAIDYMDDGSPIELSITIDPEAGFAIFDFEGTGPEMRGNLNAPPSVVHSAVLYCLRAMLDEDIPLNAGCLMPIDVRIPENSILNPSETCAVVGGNVVTSQRVTDVVLRAFEAVAASQGCCNNLTFGAGGKSEDGQVEEGWGYYETIAGGSGAGDGWHGESGVHVHMTNTRITDPEILERRYPVILHEFSLRRGSGGDGKFRGGDGVVRDIEFLVPIQVSILSERRVNRPYGLRGGAPGLRGLNLWKKKTRKADCDWKSDDDKHRILNIGARATVKMGAGDHIILNTPGGGGWGSPHYDLEVACDTAAPDLFQRTVPALRTFVPRGSLEERNALQLGN